MNVKIWVFLLLGTILAACESSGGGGTTDTATALDTVTASDTETASDTAPDTAALPDLSVPEGLALLSEQEFGWYLQHLPAAVFKRSVAIPGELLNDEDFLMDRNNVFDVLYDEDEAFVGFVRRIFSPVACVLDECWPVEFLLLYADVDAFLHVRSTGAEFRDFMKYTIKGDHQPFTDEDRVRLNEFAAEPPEVLLAITLEDDLVEIGYDEETGDPVSAATLPAFQDHTITGAVFTVWLVAKYRVETDAILLSEAP